MWSEDELSVVNSIANQVAVALENARLFENTVRRAEREKKVMEITAKIRSTNDPEEMMRIAINELQESLGASRTQIYIRQEEDAVGKTPAAGQEQATGSKPAAPNGNGRSHAA
jgi:GAF domain-containing protein